MTAFNKAMAEILGLCVMLVCLGFEPVLSQNTSATAEPPPTCNRNTDPCKDGVVFPIWRPIEMSTGDMICRTIVYGLGLVWCFCGVAIIADRFMASIEVITSKERTVKIKSKTGEVTKIKVRIWNETVSNLSLMALGSSAPEILLSIVEVIGRNFEAGELGPGTIVGSAAFNLFCIIGFCCYVIPDGQVRRIKHLRVFCITASWSIFAYLWLYVIIAVISPGEIQVWEGVLTFLFFPITILTAYIAERRLLFYKYLNKNYRAGLHKGIVVITEGADDDEDLEMGKLMNNNDNDTHYKGIADSDDEVKEFEKHRLEYIEILRGLRKDNPDVDMKKLEEMAQAEAMNRGPKSRAFYRIQSIRKLTGGASLKKPKIGQKSALDDEAEDPHVTKIFFEPGHYTVMESVGSFQMTVARSGGNLRNTIYVDYKTEDGSATAGTDYEYAEGTLVFQPGETHQQFAISIIDDDIFEEDEHFFVLISNVRVGGNEGMISEHRTSEFAKLTNPVRATVMILDDDHAGMFYFESEKVDFVESIGEAHIKVARATGARGCVKIPYKTIEGTAKDGRDYEDVHGELTFENDETEKYIAVRIIDDEQYEKNETFFVELGEPRLVRRGSGAKVIDDNIPEDDLTEDDKIARLGKPQLGDPIKCTVHIKESMEFKNTVDKLLKETNTSMVHTIDQLLYQNQVVVGTSSWREQFKAALSVVEEGDEDDDGEEGEEKLPSCMDYVMHFLTIFWKVLFAIVPPTDYWGGWACFIVSIIWIGILTTIIGDLASSFGCTIGLKDSVTAISFVALGTSVPDTFASKVAAIGDKYADSSVGNVTGSNAVNVFLGIGLAWGMAAIVHAAKGTKFIVKPGSLGFSVTVFCIFACIAIATIMFRRKKSIGGELGGPRGCKIVTTILLSGLWVFYIILSSLESYCYIPGF
ncbi:unnamed protein product [Owenia fusiformis]|uniref:Calx-beta domain-containing protein n=1 Tax=Owenia fusiformis TaxID=6347 RepID=A0A8S4PFP8_OWEFU|nr:unnamed protein product [Owenia fusiformis]